MKLVTGSNSLFMSMAIPRMINTLTRIWSNLIFRIFAARKYSSAVIVCTGAAKCGELELSREPTDSPDYVLYNNGNLAADESHKWVSGISNSVVRWPTPVVFTDDRHADNGIARISLDTNGYALWWCEITSIKGNPGRVVCVASVW